MSDFKNLDRLLQKYVDDGLPNCSCMIAKKGEILYENYFGWADKENTVPLTVDCQHFFRQIFLGYFSDIVQAFDTLRKNVCGDDYTSLHNPIVLSSVLPAYGMFHSIQILFL